ncbi:WhiB family transcriptional regulator [Saccharopolyspora shandongensis]|uniref:WhiB family transcriptional regulator n=1 Tax=Saccharopolyspora shandongensis TaxID=418495 RepID=UPI00342D2AD2
MSAQERIERGDGLYRLLTRLNGEDFGGHPECAETDPDVFSPEPGRRDLVKVAKAICGRCPIAAACRENAIRSGEHGIWGGTTESERRQILRRRKLVVVQGNADEVSRAAERALAAIEKASGAPVPGLRRHVEDVLRWADENGDSDADRAEAVLIVLRPELQYLGLDDIAEEVAA